MTSFISAISEIVSFLMIILNSAFSRVIYLMANEKISRSAAIGWIDGLGVVLHAFENSDATPFQIASVP